MLHSQGHEGCSKVCAWKIKGGLVREVMMELRSGGWVWVILAERGDCNIPDRGSGKFKKERSVMLARRWDSPWRLEDSKGRIAWERQACGPAKRGSWGSWREALALDSKNNIKSWTILVSVLVWRAGRKWQGESFILERWCSMGTTWGPEWMKQWPNRK
jgi:hypothetical protein